MLLKGASKVINLPVSAVMMIHTPPPHPAHPPTPTPHPSLTFVLLKGASKIIKLPVGTVMMICGVAGAGAAVVGGGIGMPLLFRAKKRWDEVRLRGFQKSDTTCDMLLSDAALIGICHSCMLGFAL